MKMLEATRSRKRQETDPSLQPSEGVWPCGHLDVHPVILMSDFGLRTVTGLISVIVKPPSLWGFATKAMGTNIHTKKQSI